MSRRISNVVRLSLAVVMLLAVSAGCAARPEVAATSPDACHWPYGCDVKPQKTPEILDLAARARLPADTFTIGPPSGSELGDQLNGRRLPFEDQPVQGFSAVIDAGGTGDAYWLLPDNGYGVKNNSSDFLLRMYQVRIDFESGRGSSGDISVEGFIKLRDPDGLIPFPITNENTEDRLLTGADFDPESVRRDEAGDLWFGDEYGPYLLHTDATGRVLEAPYPLPGVAAPENPYLGSPKLATLPSSKGFEGMAISGDGRFLYVALGGALEGDPDQRRRFIYEFNLQYERYTGRYWQYRADSSKDTITELTSPAEDPNHRLLVVERSGGTPENDQSADVYLVALGQTDSSGFLVKRKVLGLPYPHIESLIPLDDRRMLIFNDNDYPFTTNDTQGLIVRLGKPLPKEP
ncbi:MAG: esterase-like activity of phytase family protein [Rubrobacteraceae bacterium]|nr:esterase-like activity of phytase family protein [Rubrobacteraceae bacterium]